MPEGDSVYKFAAMMRPALLGASLVDAFSRTRDLRSLAGRAVERIDTHGKQTVFTLAEGPAVLVHLGLGGTWKRFQPGAAWPRSKAALAWLTADDVFVALNARNVQVLDRRAVPLALAHLGPDLLAEPDFEAISARFRATGLPTLAEALLDQGIAAGIGNVYKSELCFLARRLPDAPPGDVDPEPLYRMAAELLAANLGPGPRRTRPAPGPPLWVYGRDRQPCLRCRTPVRTALLAGRPTWWCPSCQSQGPGSGFAAMLSGA